MGRVSIQTGRKFKGAGNRGPRNQVNGGKSLGEGNVQ